MSFSVYRPRLHRLIAWLAIGVSVSNLIPIPVPSSRTTAHPTFPCEGGQCGCATAQQCWKSCCCHTLQERLAWARQHGVLPPKELEARHELAARSSMPVRKQRKRATCCSPCEGFANQTNSCVSQPSSLEPSRPTTGWVTVIDAQRCRGNASLNPGTAFSSLGMPPPVTQPDGVERAGSILPGKPECYSRCDLPPPTPPPQSRHLALI
jgi:hypothetical protein